MSSVIREKTEHGEVTQIDMRGLVCPASLLTALREMNTHRDSLLTGRLALEFLTDNRDATVTVPSAAAAMGYSATIVNDEANLFRINVMLQRTP